MWSCNRKFALISLVVAFIVCNLLALTSSHIRLLHWLQAGARSPAQFSAFHDELSSNVSVMSVDELSALGMSNSLGFIRDSNLAKNIDELIDAIPSPIFLIFSHADNLQLSKNLICNALIFPPFKDHLAFVVPDFKIYHEIQQFLGRAGGICIADLVDFGGHQINWKSLQLFGLHRALERAQLAGKIVIFLDPAVVFGQNPLDVEDLYHQTDLSLVSDGQMYSSDFMRFSPTREAITFFRNVLANTSADASTFAGALSSAILHHRGSYTRLDCCRYLSGPCAFSASNSKPFPCDDVPFVLSSVDVHSAQRINVWHLNEGGDRCKQRDLRVAVMTMDRPHSLARLIRSLNDASYPQNATVDLQVTVDADDGVADPRTIGYLRDLRWRFGILEVKVWRSRKGIFWHWLDAWPCESYPRDLYRAVVLLEDDTEVSPIYFDWFTRAHEMYCGGPVGVVAGQRQWLVPKQTRGSRLDQLIPPGVNAFGYRLVATWGLSPCYDTWRSFRVWAVANYGKISPTIGDDDNVLDQWYKNFLAEGRQHSMWEIWFIRYCKDHDIFTVYPWLEKGAVVRGWTERGLHFDGADPKPDHDFVSIASWNEALQKGFPPRSLLLLDFDLSVVKSWTPKNLQEAIIRIKGK